MLSIIICGIFGFAAGFVISYLLSKTKNNETIVKLKISENKEEMLQGKINELTEKLSVQKSEMEKLQETARLQFENIANKILEEKSQKFTEANKSNLEIILNPLKEDINKFKKQVEETYVNEVRDKATLMEAIKNITEANKQMTQEADKLTRALKGDSKVQGDWGEFQLEVLLEKSGLINNVNFHKQQNYKTEENANVRPDFTVDLPENKCCIIDSKVSLTSYEQYFNTEDKNVKEKALSEHVASIKRHIKDLSKKKYEKLDSINSPDFVFMFIPVEPALTLALQNNSSLMEDALKENVVLVVPSTLLVAMRTVAYIWKVEKQNKNVQEIAKTGGELYDKFAGFTDNMIKVGNQMGIAQNTYKEAMGQLYKKNTDGSNNAGTILGKMEKLKELGANTTKHINPNLLSRIEE